MGSLDPPPIVMPFRVLERAASPSAPQQVPPPSVQLRDQRILPEEKGVLFFLPHPEGGKRSRSVKLKLQATSR